MAIPVTPTKRARIVTWKAEGRTNKWIASQFHIDPSTVRRINRKYSHNQNFYYTAPRSGRPRKLTPRDRKFGARKVESGQVENATVLRDEYFRHVSARTVRRALHQEGLKAYTRQWVPFIKKPHMKARRLWSRDVVGDWQEEEWRRVWFSDEKKFELFGSDGRRWVWRRPGRALDPRYTKKRVKHGGGHIMVWGIVTPFGVGRLVRIEGNMTGAQYQDILEEGLLGTARDHGVDVDGFIFQQDNDPKHKARRVQHWLDKNGITRLVWPPSTADINIIENLWGYLQGRLRLRGRPHNKEELWRVLQDEWHRIPLEYIQRLYASLPSRIQALSKAKGGNIPY